MKNIYSIEGEITKIHLEYKGQGYVAVIDTKNLELVKSLGTSWYINNNKNSYKSVRTQKYKNRNKKPVVMANLILNPPKGMIVDHINGDSFDNRESNLRIIPPWGNNQNISMLKNNKSGFRGVSWYKATSKWRAKAVINKKPYHLGYFDTAEEANEVVVNFRKQRMLYSCENAKLEGTK
jgi:hypothetical protein